MTNGLYGRCIHDLNPTECSECDQNQKLRGLIELDLALEKKYPHVVFCEKHVCSRYHEFSLKTVFERLLKESKK